MARKSPVIKVVVGLLSFLIVWILDAANMVGIIIFSIQTQNGCTSCMHEEKNMWTEQILKLFQEKFFILMF